MPQERAKPEDASRAFRASRHLMISIQDVCLDELAQLRMLFNWNRPACPCGGLRVWGHGRVERYFPNIEEPLLVQRFRCNDCQRVFTCRPACVWPRFLSAAITVIEALATRLTSRFWPPSIPRQRGGHWLKRISDAFLACPAKLEPLEWLHDCGMNMRWPFTILV